MGKEGEMSEERTGPEDGEPGCDSNELRRKVARLESECQRLKVLKATNRGLARANARAAELVAEVELRDAEIEKLNTALAAANARAATLMADLELNMEELARSNQELERFAFAASHDLQNPLRTIAGLVSVVLRTSPPETPPAHVRHLTLAREEAERMLRMLSDLLEYSRLHAGDLRRIPVDLDDLLDQVLIGLSVAIEAEQARITRAPLPSVLGYRTPLGRLLQNLLSNSLKFRGTEAPEIHVSATETEEEWVVSVEDNGIGLDPADSERIFQMFQRLHPNSTYGGTGMGLAFCKKIVDLHGGRIWVDSELGKGARFSFSLRKAGSPGLPTVADNG